MNIVLYSVLAVSLSINFALWMRCLNLVKLYRELRINYLKLEIQYRQATMYDAMADAPSKNWLLAGLALCVLTVLLAGNELIKELRKPFIK